MVNNMEFGKTYVSSYGLNVTTFTQDKKNIRVIRKIEEYLE